MATFQAQVEALTQLTMGSGDAPSTSELTQFLKDGVLDVTDKWLIGHPQDRELFMDETGLQVAQGANLDGAAVISVVRADGVTAGNFRPCRKISPALQSQVTDTESLSFASKYHPVYMLNSDNKVAVFPAPSDNSGKDSYKVYYVNNTPLDGDGNALTEADSTLRAFPADRIYLVVLYASVQSLQVALANSVISLSITSPTAPSASVLSSPGVATTALADVTGNIPTYTKPVMSATSFSDFSSGLTETDPGTLTITAVVPVPPSGPSFTTPDVGTATVASFGSAPVFVPSALSKVTTYIETDQDVELASAKIQQINAEMQSSLNTFNAANVAYQAEIQQNIQQAQIDAQEKQAEASLLLQQENQEYVASLQRYSAEVTTYQADVAQQVQQYQANLGQYTSELNVSVQAWQQEESTKIAQYQADIQNELNEFNKENVRYQANIQAEITQAQLDAQEAQKEGDMTLQASFTEYANNLQKYQAEVADYQAEVGKEIQESTTKTQQYQSLYVQLLQQYGAAFQVAQPQQGGR